MAATNLLNEQQFVAVVELNPVLSVGEKWKRKDWFWAEVPWLVGARGCVQDPAQLLCPSTVPVRRRRFFVLDFHMSSVPSSGTDSPLPQANHFLPDRKGN